MSKVLKISKHNLEIATVQLTAPRLLIGRSPLCDQILRAPEIRPIHFLLEWLGEGEFDPDQGLWTLYDMGNIVGKKQNETEVYDDFTAEGVVIDDEFQHLGLTWTITEDRITATHIADGIISTQLKSTAKNNAPGLEQKLALEVVCLNKKKQKVQDIWHFFNQKITKSFHDSKIPYRIDWKEKSLASLHFESAPQAIFNLKGQKMALENVLNLNAHDTFIIHLNEDIYFVRFINRVEYEMAKFNIYQFKFWFINFSSLLIFCALLWSINKNNLTTKEVENLNPIRVVKVVETVVPEVVAPPPPPEVVEVLPPPPEVIPPAKEEVVELKKVEPAPKAVPPPKKIAIAKKADKVIAPPVKVTDINAVGLLGRFKKTANKFPPKQISAEEMTQSYATNLAAGTDHKGILVQTSQMGIVGLQKNLDANNSKGDSSLLIEAQTSLKGAGELNSVSSAPMAQAHGIADSDSTSAGIIGLAKKTKELKAISNEDVSGGLTKAQVYTVINEHRREVRTCFESALLVRNDLNGILRLSFGINPAGSVTEIKVLNSEIDSSILQGCVAQVIRQMVFPQSVNQLSTKVIYPFVFKRSF